MTSMDKSHNVLVVAPDALDPTSYYRAWGPLLTLEKNWSALNLFEPGPRFEDFNWSTFRRSDLAFFQRPASGVHARLIQLAKEHRVPVWVDYDDDLFSVPKDNKSADIYDKMQGEIRFCIENADVVTCTNEHLKGVLSRFNQNVEVIENAYDDQWLTLDKPAHEPRKFVVWRGDSRHQADLMDHADTFIKASYEFTDWMFVFVGYHPFLITEKMRENSWTHAQAMPILTYMHFLEDLKASIHVVPLRDRAFNHSKSNIAWIEATNAGSTVLAPDFPQWQNKGCVNYQDVDSFRDNLFRMMANYKTLKPNHDHAVGYIKKHLLLSEVNKKRMALIEKTACHR